MLDTELDHAAAGHRGRRRAPAGHRRSAVRRRFDRFADARVVLLGEASHGTSEFYRARAAISRRLIERHGFNIVAVEADWPDAATIDRYVRHRPARDRRIQRVRALPDLDVAQHRRRRLHPLDARPQRRAAPTQQMCRLLRARPLQSRRLDAGGDRLPREGRSRARPARAPPLRLPRAVGRRTRRPMADIRCSKAMRGARSA